eukprot:TRINITY_DN1508_c0_g1_i2.p1 TRINITY_DN1508_c0_g1~~TRINITY_DN1508_c0_g1_i2.p1  ORF type:complete len:344 (+),score=61.17 TRINITY_DN1508_c0_g1_i2:139-1170(+)
MEQLRDQRLRGLFKERYDTRANLIDWDYQMQLKDEASIIHWTHYKEFRLSGVAFEMRFSTYIIPNRTLSSFVPGKKKGTRESVLVRGYWGDVSVSPFIAFGVETDSEPENKKMFEIRNTQHVSHALAVSIFNVHAMLHKMETLKEYHLDFDETSKPSAEPEKKQRNDKKIDKPTEEIKEEDEDEEADVAINKENQKDEAIKTPPPELPEETKQNEQKEDGKIDNRPIIFEEPSELLQGIKRMNIKILPISDDLERIAGKKKYGEFFDCVVVGLMFSNVLQSQALKPILKKGCTVFVENAKFLVPLKRDQRKLVNDKLKEFGKNNGLKEVPFSRDHHIKFVFEG